jgi:ATP-binding cassette, subfamily B, bacterial
MPSVFKKLYPFLKPYKLKIFWAAVSLVFTSVATLSLGQGLRVLVDLGFSNEETPEVNSTFTLDISAYTNYEKLAIAIAFLGAIGILIALGTFVRHYLVSWLGERISSDLRVEVYKHIIHMEPSYFEETSAGDIQSRILTDTTLLQTVVGSSFSIFLRNFLIFVLGIIWLFVTNPKLTSIVLVSVPLVVFPILIFGRKVRKLSKETQDKLAGIGSQVNESLFNIRTVQAFHQESYEKSKFNRFVEIAFNVSAYRILFRSFMIVIVITLVLAGISFMIWAGGIDVIEGRISSGELIAFSFYAIMVASSLGSISEVIGELQRAAGATERLIELLQLEPKINSPINSKTIRVSSSTENPYSIKFSDVLFHYPSRPDRATLDQLSLEIPAGKVTALVGPSGAGKSTIFDLIYRFHDPQSGSIQIGNVTIKDFSLEYLRSTLGLVPQEPNLFSGTVSENIRYGKLDASDDEVKAAAEASFSLDFINDLPSGFDSQLGENGVRLSGGQKQRLAIARAILKNPKILLLDEATSSLDSESEMFIQQALKELTKNRTTLMIAHRLSTVINADLIHVIENGKLVGSGNHDELLKANELYQKLARLQLFR